mgnify:CR=1 FL=1
MPRGRRLDVRTRPFRPPRGPEASGRRVCAGTRFSPSASTASCSRAPRRARTTSASACATTEASGGAAGRMHMRSWRPVSLWAARDRPASSAAAVGSVRTTAYAGMWGARRQARCLRCSACEVSCVTRIARGRRPGALLLQYTECGSHPPLGLRTLYHRTTDRALRHGRSRPATD